MTWAFSFLLIALSEHCNGFSPQLLRNSPGNERKQDSLLLTIQKAYVEKK